MTYSLVQTDITVKTNLYRIKIFRLVSRIYSNVKGHTCERLDQNTQRIRSTLITL